MTAAVESPEPFDWAAIAHSLRSAFQKIGDLLRQLARAIRPIFRLFKRYGRGYSSPAPLVIDGHAYALRRRARVRRKARQR